MDTETFFLLFTAAIYNAAVVVIMLICFRNMDIKSMLREKRYSVVVSPAPAVPINNSNGNGNSYSRIVGCAGAVILASFIWALGDAVIYQAYKSPKDVGGMLTGVAPFILSGAALFAPYAFNQLSTLFPPKS